MGGRTSPGMAPSPLPALQNPDIARTRLICSRRGIDRTWPCSNRHCSSTSLMSSMSIQQAPTVSAWLPLRWHGDFRSWIGQQGLQTEAVFCHRSCRNRPSL